MTDSASDQSVTAGILVIGDEILSGRTKDSNSGYICEYLSEVGIEVREIRTVPDVSAMIVEAVDALRERYTYVFTTGGIGPTHDDITADAIASAFGVGIDIDERAVALMRHRYPNADLTSARLRMARIPQGADLIENAVSGAPGFHIGNVFVMAGVPRIMQSMLDEIGSRLKTGRRIFSETINAPMPEGKIAEPLAKIAEAHPDVQIGSYPHFDGTRFLTQIVVRSRETDKLAAAKSAVEAAVAELTVPDK
ncbi:competence/damage-inducible protein A [Amorphus sp. 3PC139-8]|uniref:competence/damage-inducible protein A n=1 Tax=Amorphus sp. 3PC139-8 TaxID=2735676 RepID=UPI00345C91D7